MKNLILISLLLILSACDNSGDTQPNGNSNTPTIIINEEWGKLECQKKLDCVNPILNLDYQKLHDFISLQLPQGLISEKNNSIEFSCGLQFIELWLEEFPQHNGATYDELKQITEFGRQLINICTNHPDVSEKMKKYLTNTKEYGNEL